MSDVVKDAPDMLHVSVLLELIETIKIRCQNCKSPIGAFVFDEYIMKNRLVCRECQYDNGEHAKRLIEQTLSE